MTIVTFHVFLSEIRLLIESRRRPEADFHVKYAMLVSRLKRESQRRAFMMS